MAYADTAISGSSDRIILETECFVGVAGISFRNHPFPFADWIFHYCQNPFQK
jgi:hypothetical protein